MQRILICVTLFSCVACRKQTPVEEISVNTSGVKLQETEVTQEAVWPMFRGPEGNGISPDQPLPTRWSQDEGIRWMADIPGRGHGSPIVTGNQVLVASALDAQEKQVVYAYDLATGEPNWELVVHEGGFPKPGEIHNKGSNANSSLASDGQRAYIAFFNSARVFATAIGLDGKQLWQTDLGAFASKFGYAPSPVLYKSFVIFAVDNFGGGYIAAVDAQSGKIAWRIGRPAKNSHSTPYIANLGGKDQLLISGCDTVSSYDPATGDLLWETTGTSETTCGTIVTTPDHVFASGGYPGKQTLCLDAEGKIVWQNKVNIYEPSMLVAGDSLFAISDRGIAYCWATTDGQERWKKRLGGNFSASPLLCNGLIYVADLSGTTHVFRADSSQYVEVAQNTLGNDMYASPAVANGALLMRVGFGLGDQRSEKLVCIGD